jgi:hypothetical protein
VRGARGKKKRYAVVINIRVVSHRATALRGRGLPSKLKWMVEPSQSNDTDIYSQEPVMGITVHVEEQKKKGSFGEGEGEGMWDERKQERGKPTTSSALRPSS